MDKSYFITHYEFTRRCYKTIHSAGSNQFFYSPCIGYIKKGNAKFFYKGKTYYAYKGDLIYIGAETRYESIWFGSPEIEWYSINFDFSSRYAFFDYRFQILKNYPSTLLDKIYETYEEEPMESLSYFYALLNYLYKNLKNTPAPSAYLSIKPAIEYIEKNYDKPVSIQVLSNLCHLSESGFFKLFKKATGVTPISYKHNIMIQHSIDLISNTTLSIEEISNQAGFSSSNYFRKIFIKLTDKTPKELRRK